MFFLWQALSTMDVYKSDDDMSAYEDQPNFFLRDLKFSMKNIFDQAVLGYYGWDVPTIFEKNKFVTQNLNPQGSE